ncbi:MAG TPA: hypothetical protein VNS52_05210 [Gemmatimonadaceae bacterium]|nr:hypothetical protein [Gemmatimonadaceae bacterium]
MSATTEVGHDAPSPRARLLVALAVGILAAIGVVVRVRLAPWHSGSGQTDFDYIWFAGRALLHGQDPYALIGQGRAFEWPWPLFYPLTTVVGVLPLALLPVRLASALFTGVSAALLAYVVTRDGWERLAIFASASAFAALQGAQWSPLLTAAGAVPALSVLLVLKPNLCVAFVAAQPTARRIRDVAIAGALLAAVAFALRPGWVTEWRSAVASSIHFRIFLFHPLGAVLILALLRWRRFDARLLLAMACVPQTPLIYEALPLFLIPATRREMLVLLLLSALSGPAQVLAARGLDPVRGSDMIANVMIAAFYIPCLVMVLRRPNEGPVPAWVERLADAARARLGGWRRRASDETRAPAVADE